jgi:hypothetical protein
MKHLTTIAKKKKILHVNVNKLMTKILPKIYDYIEWQLCQNKHKNKETVQKFSNT